MVWWGRDWNSWHSGASMEWGCMNSGSENRGDRQVRGGIDRHQVHMTSPELGSLVGNWVAWVYQKPGVRQVGLITGLINRFLMALVPGSHLPVRGSY